jgi:hypothetical protein
MLTRSFKETVRSVVEASQQPLTPQEIKEVVKAQYPEFHGTPSHLRNVERGHYTTLDHALLAQIYGVVKTNDEFFCDDSTKPYKVSLTTGELAEDAPELEDFDVSIGNVYVLKTGTYTQQGREIIKIGFTSQAIEKRILQLYTTGVPFEFSVHKVYSTRNFIELEQALHKLLTGFRINKSREFFTDDALPFIDGVVEIHRLIQAEVKQ